MAGHYCREHQTVWFKSKNMKHYAHPVEGEFDENGRQVWCEEPKSESQEQPEKPSSAKPVYGQDSPEKRRSIERQSSAAIGCANLPPPKDMNEALTRAEQVYQWISVGTIRPPTPSSTPDKSTTASPKAQTGSEIPKITPESVFGQIKTLIKGMDDEKRKAVLTELFAETGALGDTLVARLRSLSQENLLKVSARVNKALNDTIETEIDE